LAGNTNDTSGVAGIVLSYAYLIAGIVGMATRNSKGGGITTGVFFLLGALFGFVGDGTLDSALKFFAYLALFFGLFFIVGSIMMKKPSKNKVSVQQDSSTYRLQAIRNLKEAGKQFDDYDIELEIERIKREQSASANANLAHTEQQPTDPFYKKLWFWIVAAAVLIIVILCILFSGKGSKAESVTPQPTPSEQNTVPESVPSQPEHAVDEEVVEEETESTPAIDLQADIDNNATYVAKTKTFFHDKPDESTVRKAYLVEGNEVQFIGEAQNGFGYVEFSLPNSTRVTKGWMKISDFTVKEE
jgi:hypothetical protein